MLKIRLPMLDSCCCGCTLKTGALYIGLFDSVVGTIFLISSIFSASYYDPDLELYGTFISSSTFSAIYLAMAIMLCFGASKGNYKLLRPWLIYIVIYTIVYIVTAILNAVAYFSISEPGYGSALIISIVIVAFVEGYFFLVVYSLYKNLIHINPGYPMDPNFARSGNV